MPESVKAMLARLSEPELMDDPDQAQAYSDGAFADAHDAFVAFGIDRVGTMSGRVLDAGCGPADPTVRFARANPDARVVAVDASTTMLVLAQRRVTESGLAHQITLARHFLPDPALNAPPFDGVISNSLLHHLADPMALWTTIWSATRAGAAVVVMDLVRPNTEAEVDQLVARYASGAPDVLRTDYRNSLRAAYRPEEVQRQLDHAGLGHLLVEQVTDRHLLVTGRR